MILVKYWKKVGANFSLKLDNSDVVRVFWKNVSTECISGSNYIPKHI